MIYVDGVSELAAIWYLTIAVSTWVAARLVTQGIWKRVR